MSFSASRSSSPALPAPSTNIALPSSEGAKTLQDRLHALLTKLAKAMDIIKEWPDNNDGGVAVVKGRDDSNTSNSSSPHMDMANKLTMSVLEVLTALQALEGVIKVNAMLRKSLQECHVPINLLDLLDHGNGLNPDCFSRGLLREALGQLAGLRRRKKALEMLGAAVQKGLDQKDAEQEKDQSSGWEGSTNVGVGAGSASQKRKQDKPPANTGHGVLQPPPAKKAKTDTKK